MDAEVDDAQRDMREDQRNCDKLPMGSYWEAAVSRELFSGSVKGGSCGDCLTSGVTAKQEAQEQQLGGMGSAQPKGRVGGEVPSAERCMALFLPKDLSRRIFAQLDYRHLVHCSLVCKQWRSESAELRQAWREELYWEARLIRGVRFVDDSPSAFSHFHRYL